MKDEKLAKLVKDAKTNRELLNVLIDKFQPLINSYCRKLFYLDPDDAKQEMYLAIIESVRNIPCCKTDGQCITYITNAVKYKYCFLCRKNIVREENEDLYEEDIEKVYVEEYGFVELLFDCNKIALSLQEKKKEILQYIVDGYTDREIAKKIGVSRQYVNRVKNEIKELLLQNSK